MATRFYFRGQKRRYDNTSWYPSPLYQRKSNDLWWQCQEGHIDNARYLEMLEAIKTEEIDYVNKKYPPLARDPETRVKIENGIWEYEHRSNIARAKEVQRRAEVERIQSLTPLEKYKEEIPETIARYREESNYYRRIANRLQGFLIFGSVLVTSLTSAAGFEFGGIFKWLAPTFSILVAVSAGFIGYFKYRERSFNLQQTADAIEQEYNALQLGIRYYKKLLPQDALELFAERVELLKDEQKKRQQLLDQPPDIKHGHNPL